MRNLFLLLLCIGLFSSHATAAEEPGPPAASAVWVEMVGEAAGSDYDPPREVLERAKNEAKRKAIDEAVGSFIRSHTLVSNSQLAEDLTYARVRGKIDKVQVISEERDKNDPNLYRVRLKALVRPVYPEEGESLHLKLDLSKRRVREGEEVKVLYQANADCMIYIFSVAADNSVTLLFPNSLFTDNSIKANTGYVFPPENSTVKLKALRLPGQPGTAEEKIKVIATRRKEIILQGFQEGLFKVYDARSTGLVGDLARKLNQLDPADWGEALVVYTIEPAQKNVSQP